MARFFILDTYELNGRPRQELRGITDYPDRTLCLGERSEAEGALSNFEGCPIRMFRGEDVYGESVVRTIDKLPHALRAEARRCEYDPGD